MRIKLGLLRAAAVGVALLLALFALAACGESGDDVQSPAQGIDQITRQVLQLGQPGTAPGQALELTRVIIPDGMEIAPHTHPGVQLAVIVEGTLTYSVLSGQVGVSHHAGTDQETTETIGAGETVELEPGSSVVETPGMVHQARNDSGRSVVIYLSSLFPAGAPASSPAE